MSNTAKGAPQKAARAGDTIVLIPARLKATRLPGKPLADILGTPMIVHVWKRAVAANIGPVVVACEDEEIADAVRAAGGTAELTGTQHRSGSDRIFEALTRIDPGKHYHTIVNVQGDLPNIEPDVIAAVVDPLKNPAVKIGTVVRKLHDGELGQSHVVKAHARFKNGDNVAVATAFTRESEKCMGNCWHHIGIYAYRRASLERFVRLKPSTNEQKYSLEQLRAMDDGMVMGVRLVETESFGVDTPGDLEKARAFLARPPKAAVKAK